MLIAKSKTTKEYINCFQTKADRKTIVHNAANLGFSEDDIEFVDVDKKDYYKALAKYKKDNPMETKPKPTMICPECRKRIEIK